MRRAERLPSWTPIAGRLLAAFGRVGQQLLTGGKHAHVDPSWARHTWLRRRYPQQCYPKAIRYVLDHPRIAGLRLVHGVVAHAPRFIPFDHAWVELPGRIVFDAVVQAFFTHDSYDVATSAMALDRYSRRHTERLLAVHGHPGPWTAKWILTPPQLRAYVLDVAGGELAETAWGTSLSLLSV